MTRLINPITAKTVMFDDCQHATGIMIEAKGPTFTDILRKEIASPSMNWGVVTGALDQSLREVRAAGPKPIEWYFADEFAADYFRTEFKKTDLGRERIIIKVLPYEGRRK